MTGLELAEVQIRMATNEAIRGMQTYKQLIRQHINVEDAYRKQLSPADQRFLGDYGAAQRCAIIEVLNVYCRTADGRTYWPGSIEPFETKTEAEQAA